MNNISILLSKYSSISIIGMCKNAGKTTAMNHIIADFFDENLVLGLTSIGRDGESVDRVTGTKKPGIFIREGTLFATSSGLLSSCDVTREILENTNVPTPLGDVIIARALSDGFVELGGPSIVDQLVNVKESFFKYGAEKVVIDGAISRKTLCSSRLSDGTVLCSGASCGKSVEAVVDETAHVCELLMLPLFSGKMPQMHSQINNDKYLLTDGSTGNYSTFSHLEDLLKSVDGDTLFVSGAFTDKIAEQIAKSGAEISHLRIVLEDASKALLSKNSLEMLKIRRCKIEVLSDVNLVAVTVNPFSAYGYNFDKKDFLTKMKNRLPVDVFDVEE